LRKLTTAPFTTLFGLVFYYVLNLKIRRKFATQASSLDFAY